MGVIGKAVNHAIEKFIDLISETKKGFTQNARLYTSPGEDAVPCKEDHLILVKVDGTGKYVAVGVLAVSQGAKPGEKIIYARDSDGKIVSKITMLNDGSIQIEAKTILGEAEEKNTLKGADVEISGNTKLTGGSVECSGTAPPTGTGCWCAKPFCTYDGSPHTGNKAEGA